MVRDPSFCAADRYKILVARPAEILPDDRLDVVSRLSEQLYGPGSEILVELRFYPKPLMCSSVGRPDQVGVEGTFWVIGVFM